MSLDDGLDLKIKNKLDWVLPQSTNFMDFINTKLKSNIVKDVKKEVCDISGKPGEIKKLIPTAFQETLQKLINDDTPYRGLLLYHGLGSGKTFTSLNISENMNRQVVILLPAALKSRWIDEFAKVDPDKYGKPANYATLPPAAKKGIDKNIEEKIGKKYTFLSHNAYNVADKLFQLRQKERSKIVREGEGELDSGYVVKHIGSLDNKLLIIDEVHNLLTNIINPDSKNGIRIYEMVMRAKNLKILALSGTPVVNDPYELSVLFNMLRGPIYVGTKEYFTVFPDDYNKFQDYFVDRANNTIKNKNIFQERITGLVSYVRGSNDENLDVYPSSSFEQVNVPMSLYQWKVYVKARQKEIEKELRQKSFAGIQNSASKFKKPSPDGSTDFKVGSRTASNFAFPERVPKPKPIGAEESLTEYKKRIEDVVEELGSEVLKDNLAMYSPKFKWIIDFLNKNTKGLVLIYSDFLSLEGLGLLKEALKYYGFAEFNSENSYDKKYDFKRFTEFSGNIDDEQRKRNIASFKQPDNKDGRDARLLLITSAGAEGLDLVNVRNIILLEPYFHNNVLRQVIGRGVRRCSHVLLPKEARNVKVYLLVGTRPKIEEGKGMSYPGSDKMTTDQMLLTRALTKEKINGEFLNSMKEIAIDCTLDYELNKSAKNPFECAKCAGNYKDKSMYEPNIEIHLIKGNSHCIAPEKTVISQVIEVKGKEYGIDQNGNLYDMNTQKKVGKMKNGKPDLN